MTIHVNVDPANPGQFFACCGLLEVADRLWNCAEGWFEANTFCISTEEAETSLLKLLTAARDFRLSEHDSAPPDEDDGEQEDGADDKTEPLAIVSPISLRLDWWGDKSIKTWAGSMNARQIFLAMCNAIDPQHTNPFNQSRVVFDTQAASVSAKSKRDKNARKREPFYFDARRGASAWSIDVGFSADSLKLSTLAHPVVEALCLVGLQRCRPKPTRTPRVFDYFAWHIPVLASIAPAAVSGLVGDGDCYRFANNFRTDQRKHKAFMPATRVPRSSR